MHPERVHAVPDCRVLPFFGAEVGWPGVKEEHCARPFRGKAFIVSRSDQVIYGILGQGLVPAFLSQYQTGSDQHASLHNGSINLS